MKFFRQSRPQDLFEKLWAGSFGLLSRIWETTLLAHSEKSARARADLLNLLETKSERALEIADEMFEMNREVSDIFYKTRSEPYKEDWYKFVEKLIAFQTDLTTFEVRIFLLKDVLMQIDETHPHWRQIDDALKISLEKIERAKAFIDESTFDHKTSEAVHNAIVIARALDENISFEEADRRERKRWE